MARSTPSAPCSSVPMSTIAVIDTTASLRSPSITVTATPTTRAQTAVSAGTSDRILNTLLCACIAVLHTASAPLRRSWFRSRGKAVPAPPLRASWAEPITASQPAFVPCPKPLTKSSCAQTDLRVASGAPPSYCCGFPLHASGAPRARWRVRRKVSRRPRHGQSIQPRRISRRAPLELSRPRRAGRPAVAGTTVPQLNRAIAHRLRPSSAATSGEQGPEGKRSPARTAWGIASSQPLSQP